MTAWSHWSNRRRLGAALLGLLALLLITLGIMTVVPPGTQSIASHPNPASSYAEAVQRVAALRAQETADYNPLCHTQLLTHGQKAARAIAFIHGYTNCPNQFLPLGQQFYDLGYNVLLVPMPHQGLADVMTTDLSQLTAEEMAAYTDNLVDILRGLGDHVSVGGLSQGGVLAAWAAQTRPDLDQAVLIAPGIGLKLVPAPLTKLVVNLVLTLPDGYLWWDRLVHAPWEPTPSPSAPSPDAVQGYPRFSMHGLAQQLRLSFAVQALAQQSPPAARSIILVTNAVDGAVDNAAAQKLLAQWRAQGAANVTAYEFPASLKLDHDMIDPHSGNPHTDIVYPKLIELINAP